ncbi:MAG TPA: hypothetical protein VK901_19950 [Nitrospiraceae bacterium]|nr:hypothetical protein [Nitrospiraceae bacterium]
MKPPLISGGAGFLWSHLSDLLLQAGHFVIDKDSLLIERVKNIAHLFVHQPKQINHPVSLAPQSNE